MRTKKGILVLGVIVAMVLTVSSFALGLEKVLFVVPRPSVDVFDDVALVVASKMGYFAEEGIEVEWKGSAGGTDCTKLVATGAAQFGYPSEGVMLWSVVEGMDIMNVYQVDQINVFNFGMKPGSGIKEIKDLKGKTIALGSMAWKPICDPILKAGGLNPDTDVKYVQIDARAQAVLQGKADACLTWEMEWQLWEDQGIKLDIILGRKYFETQGNCFCASRKLVQENPALIEKFLRGVTKGIVFASTNPAAGAEIVLDMFPKLAANVSWTAAVENVRICTQEVKNSKYTKEHGFGWAATDLWAKVEEEMINSKGLDPAKKVDVNTFITNQFIESANKFDHDAIVKQANEYQLKSH